MELVAHHVKLPSYLSEFEVPHENIVLVNGRKHTNDSQNKSTSEILGNTNITLSSSVTHNLTGSPLEVDLNVLPFDESKRQQVEDFCIPVDLKVARKFLNDSNNKHKKWSDAIFCICDGNDKNRTVVLGLHKSEGAVTGTLISIRDSVDLTSIENNLDSLLQEHMKNVGTFTPKVNTKIKCQYELHRSKLSADCLLSGLWNGSILIEAVWNSLTFDIPRSGASIKMMLQIVLGHENSIFHPFFEDLLFLQQCFDVLSGEEQCQHDTPINFEFSSKKENFESMSDLLELLNVIIMPIDVPKSIEEAIQHSENSSFLDKLWNFIKYSKTVGDVKNRFDELFQSIEDLPLKSQALGEEDTETVIGKLINNMFSQLTTTPFLSHKQALEILINLGIHKLKKNYMYVINWCDFSVGEQLQHMWINDILTTSTEFQRKTLNVLNFAKSFSQFNFILWIHVILEFLQLVVEYNRTFFDKNKLMVLKYACDKFMNKPWFSNPLRLETKQFFDLSFPVTYEDVSVIYSKILAKWQLEIISNDKISSVTTMFHFSKKPIFPSVVYEKLGDDYLSTTLGNSFYFTLLERYSDQIS